MYGHTHFIYNIYSRYNHYNITITFFSSIAPKRLTTIIITSIFINRKFATTDLTFGEQKITNKQTI